MITVVLFRKRSSTSFFLTISGGCLFFFPKLKIIFKMFSLKLSIDKGMVLEQKNIFEV